MGGLGRNKLPIDQHVLAIVAILEAWSVAQPSAARTAL